MLINNSAFPAHEHVLRESRLKNRVILCDSNRIDDYQLIYNSKLTDNHNPKWSNYTINRNGLIYRHMNDLEYSDYIGDFDIDNTSIIIELSNAGALNFDNGNYYNWINDVVSDDLVDSRPFKGIKYWENYTNEQYESLNELLEYLSIFTNNYVVEDNLYREDGVKFKGVVSYSTLDRNSYSVNPLFDFKRIINENTIIL